MKVLSQNDFAYVSGGQSMGDREVHIVVPDFKRVDINSEKDFIVAPTGVILNELSGAGLKDFIVGSRVVILYELPSD